MATKKEEWLLTGGTGSLSKQIIKMLLEKSSSKIKGIRLFSRDEFKQNNLRKELGDKTKIPIAYIIGDIRDYTRLSEALRGVTNVIHTAALKHVPIAEENPMEYIQTNVYGTENVMRACIEQNVNKALFISTDKACQPVNLYGATKMCAEKLWLRGSVYSGGHRTKFAAVRYGNVIGSRGSILDVINKDKKIPITDPNMTRFWIKLPTVAQFILDTMDGFDSGCLYVPKMRSCRLDTFIKVSTGTTKKDWEIVGIRPGEKIHEQMINEEEKSRAYEFANHYVIEPHDPNAWKMQPAVPMNKTLFSDERNPFYTDYEEVIRELMES